ncbi:MAG: hypothetical protein LBK99_26085 [Opitutaceae bacterium]|nr:hypothetical protein [Opitutaceae bacterium]
MVPPKESLQPDCTIFSSVMPDYLHLSPAGFKIWTDAIETRLNELLR